MVLFILHISPMRLFRLCWHTASFVGAYLLPLPRPVQTHGQRRGGGARITSCLLFPCPFFDIKQFKIRRSLILPGKVADQAFLPQLPPLLPPNRLWWDVYRHAGSGLPRRKCLMTPNVTYLHLYGYHCTYTDTIAHHSIRDRMLGRRWNMSILSHLATLWRKHAETPPWTQSKPKSVFGHYPWQRFSVPPSTHSSSCFPGLPPQVLNSGHLTNCSLRRQAAQFEVAFFDRQKTWTFVQAASYWAFRISRPQERLKLPT